MRPVDDPSADFRETSPDWKRKTSIIDSISVGSEGADEPPWLRRDVSSMQQSSENAPEVQTGACSPPVHAQNQRLVIFDASKWISDPDAGTYLSILDF